MTRKVDIRKACREVAKQARAQQASRVDELERSLACAALAKTMRDGAEKPEAQVVPGKAASEFGDNVVPLRRKSHTILEGI